MAPSPGRSKARREPPRALRAVAAPQAPESRNVCGPAPRGTAPADTPPTLRERGETGRRRETSGPPAKTLCHFCQPCCRKWRARTDEHRVNFRAPTKRVFFSRPSKTRVEARVGRSRRPPRPPRRRFFGSINAHSPRGAGWTGLGPPHALEHLEPTIQRADKIGAHERKTVSADAIFAPGVPQGRATAVPEGTRKKKNGAPAPKKKAMLKVHCTESN